MKDIYWMVTNKGLVVQAPKSGKKYGSRKAWGNCFNTKKTAEIALKRIKGVFKRLK